MQRRAPALPNLARLLGCAIASNGDAAAASLKFVTASPSLTNDIGLGPFRVRLTVDPDLARRLLVTEAEQSCKVAMEHHVLAPVMQDGLILLEGDEWSRRRQAVASAFASDLMPDALETTRRAVRARIAAWHDIVNISQEARCIVYDVMLRFFGGGVPVGECPGELGPDAYGRNFALAERALERRIWDPLSVGERLRRIFRLPSGLAPDAEWRRPLRRRVSGHPRKEGSRDALARLCTRLPSDAVVYQELTTEIAAGATSIHHLSWTCQLLAMHPNVQARLVDEIDSRLRSGTASAEDELVDMESAPYLTAVVKESLRLYPPAPFLYRRGEDPSPVVVSIWGMHRHPRFWEKPDEFMPERWLGVSVDPRAYMPFGLGPRVCIGRRFALIESRAALVEILRQWKLNSAVPLPRPRLYIMTRPARDILVRVEALPNRRSHVLPVLAVRTRVACSAARTAVNASDHQASQKGVE